MTSLYGQLPKVPDHPAIEHEMLLWWEQEHIFDQRRTQNSGGQPWSFIDGPITANNPMGVHHCWGRSLKDLYQRYKAMRGFELRYQNGFDCQGLHVEVEVERSLGLNSKRDIEAYGVAEFAVRCRERVQHFADVITSQSRRLGMWMDWSKSYYTFSDTNIEYIWRFLKVADERGWLYRGHRVTAWCSRCGTSISQHELSGPDSYADLTHNALTVRLPLLGRPGGEALLVWTTTPWTLPANVAAAVNPKTEYGVRNGTWAAVREADRDSYTQILPGADLLGWEYRAPFADLDAQGGVTHRVIPWDEVDSSDGTGIVHIAPGAGAEDFALSREHDLPVLVPVDEDGRFVTGYGPFTGLTTKEASEQVTAALSERGLLAAQEPIVHRYPICWRCATPLIFRAADDWFVAADEVRQAMLDANATVEWTPASSSKRMADWLRNMGDWNISRRRYFGLPLPIYPCGTCGRVTVIGSVAELRQRAVRGLDQLQELHRPWIDAVTITCGDCGTEIRRIPEVGDAWLDAGIVGFSTLGWQNSAFIPGGYANGSSRELSHADLPDDEYWKRWFPADFETEMREQIRLWFYAQLFMSVTLTRRAPYRNILVYEKLRDATGREMHKSWGNAIEANEAMERMGADVMRFMYAEHAPHQNLNFGYAAADDVKRRLLTFWNSVKFFTDYANIQFFRPRLADLDAGPQDAELTYLDRWLIARTRLFAAAATDGYERFWSPAITVAFEDYVDDLSNWYIRLSRRRFYSYDDAAFRTLWHALATVLRLIAPVMPFLADHLWRQLVADLADGAPASVFLADWPSTQDADLALIADVDAARHIVALGRQARATGKSRLRQPLRKMIVQGRAGLPAELASLVRSELRVHDLEFGPVDAVRETVKLNFPVAGPRLGKAVQDVRAALLASEYRRLDDGTYQVGTHILGPDEVLLERTARDGWATADGDGFLVAIDLALDDDLVREGRLLDLVHSANSLRKEAGLDLTDRIELTIPEDAADLLSFSDVIKEEVLATSVRVGGSLTVELVGSSGTAVR